MKVHKLLTFDRVMEAVERQGTTLDNPGFCTACGAEADGCEPDARGYTCDECEAESVYGAEELLMMLA